MRSVFRAGSLLPRGYRFDPWTLRQKSWSLGSVCVTARTNYLRSVFRTNPKMKKTDVKKPVILP